MSVRAVQHVEEMFGTLAGRSSLRDAIIRDSWARCIEDHRLDPAILRPASIVTDTALKVHREAMDELLRRARSGAEALYRQVSGLGYVMLLTDQAGITVDYIGNPSATDALRRAGLYLGADWNERHAGTCAVGTCIATGEALVVHQSDHFDASHIGLTCTAAPIFAPTGELAAVLDIAALTSPEAKSSQHLALQIVKSFAHRIETANLIAAHRRDWTVKLAASRDLIEVDTEHVVTLDPAGRITGFNQSARQVFATVAGGDWRRMQPLIGQSIDDFLDCDIDGLTRFVGAARMGDNIVRLKPCGRPLFIEVVPPASVRLRSPARPVANPPLPAPLLSLGEDPAILSGLPRLARLVNASINFLIQGETGTGKEHFAKAIHAASARAARPFVPVNCAALPESLIESELFGYEPGSFTGGLARGKRGLVREAQGGTLFLDEIGDMSPAAQTRLLRVLAEREVMAVGAVAAVPVDIRVIAATHRNLSDLVREGRFRQDLYFRLNSAVIDLPPLRARDDLDWLVRRLLPGRGTAREVSAEAFARLSRHDWPGNVRELINVLDYAAAVATGPRIEVEDLPDHLRAAGVTRAPEPPPGAADPKPALTGDEAGRLRAELLRHKGNISATARSLGIDRTTLHRRMRRLGVALQRLSG